MKGGGSVARDLSWQRFGALTLIRRVPNDSFKRTRWLCKCQCGNETIAITSLLKNGHKTSCGCLLANKTFGERMKSHGHSVGGRLSSEYAIWHGIIQRCENSLNRSFHLYGGRGIFVSPQWKTFENFYADMGNRPAKHSIERRDNDGPYSPENCYWATSKQQSRNKRTTVFVMFQGREMCLADAAEIAGVEYGPLYDRVIRKGWEITRALIDLK